MDHADDRAVSMTPLRMSVAPRRELILAGALTAMVAALLMLGPAPADAPAHLYRTFLVAHGSVVWDNLWYGGQYPLASYSLLYYFAAVVVGNILLVATAAVVSTILFALIAFHEWGPIARWPARVFGVLAAAPLFTGLYSYTVGFAMLLAALRAVQRGKTWLSIVCAALTIGFSPLAFVFLCLILFSRLLANKRITTRTILLVVGLVAVGAAEAVALIVFPSRVVYPFNPIDLTAVTAVCVIGALLARRSAAGRPLASFFVVWAATSTLAYLVPSAVGDNATRLRAFIFPIMLVVAAQARFRPRLLTGVALVAALAYNIVPYVMLVPYRLDGRPENPAFWRAPLAFLHQHADANYRVEVVPTSGHWESYWIPRAGYALARGWYRQLDVTTNAALYAPHLTGRAYQSWLRRASVRYILLPHTHLDPDGAPTEARLLQTGSAGAREVFRSANWTIYEARHSQPLLTGPGAAVITLMGHQTISGAATKRGVYTLRVHYNPYWRQDPGVFCIRPGPAQMTEIDLHHPGPFTLTIDEDVATILKSLIASKPTRC
jgi:hypothetical protein